MDFTIGRFFAALSVTFSLFMLFGHDSSTAAGVAPKSTATGAVNAESTQLPQIGSAQPPAHPSASDEGKFMATGQLVGSR